MRRYAVYRTSELPWLREIPEGWQALPNIALFRERIERGYVDGDLLSVTQDRGIVRQSELEEKRDSSNDDKNNYKRVRVGDVAYNKMRMWQGAVGYSIYDGIVSPAYIVLHGARDVNVRYYFYLFKTPAYMSYSYRNSYGISDDQLSLRYEDFKRMYSLYPPRDEQDAIVAFLDRKLAEIDRFITAKERLIALLKEQNAAIINRVITKGLDANVPMKPSGIEWLGEIPEHWEVVRFKFSASIANGQVDPRMPEYINLPLVAPNHIESGTGELLQVESATEQGAESGKYQFEQGNILYSKIRPALRKACMPDFDGLCSADMYPITTKPGLLPRFLLYFLLSERFTQFAVERSMRVAMPKVNREDLNNCELPLPPLSDQEAIVQHIADEFSRLDNVTAKAEREIELIKEYRTALISDAVTGKIDVRAEVWEEVLA